MSVKTQKTKSVILKSKIFWMDYEIRNISTGLKYSLAYSSLMLINFLQGMTKMKPGV